MEAIFIKAIKKWTCMVILSLLLVNAVCIVGELVPSNNLVGVAQASSNTVKLNKKKLTLTVGKKYTLKISGTKKKVKWTSTNEKIATVTQKGVVKAIKQGNATINAKVGGKTYKCKVTVQPKRTANQKKVLELVNKERKSAGVNKLTMDDTLNAAAVKRAKELAQSFSHTRPNGTSCFTILNEDKYKVVYYAVGENIAAGQTSASSVMNSWMNSPGHRANILSGGYNKIGVGYYYDANSTYKHYWVQLFVKN